MFVQAHWALCYPATLDTIPLATFNQRFLYTPLGLNYTFE